MGGQGSKGGDAPPASGPRRVQPGPLSESAADARAAPAAALRLGTTAAAAAAPPGPALAPAAPEPPLRGRPGLLGPTKQYGMLAPAYCFEHGERPHRVLVIGREASDAGALFVG